MNAQTPIIALAPSFDWHGITVAVNDWRGGCIQCFAKAELAVTEALAALSEAPGQSEVKLRHLVGQRFQDLADALAAREPKSKALNKAIGALDQFRKHEDLRVHLAHGSATIAQTRNGDWLVVMQHKAFKSGKLTDYDLTIFEADARQILAELRTDSLRLAQCLKSLLHPPLKPAPAQTA